MVKEFPSPLERTPEPGLNKAHNTIAEPQVEKEDIKPSKRQIAEISKVLKTLTNSPNVVTYSPRLGIDRVHDDLINSKITSEEVKEAFSQARKRFRPHFAVLLLALNGKSWKEIEQQLDMNVGASRLDDMVRSCVTKINKIRKEKNPNDFYS